MRRLKQLKLIARLVNNRTNMAAKHFADARTALNKEQAKFKQLNDFCIEYGAKLSRVNIQLSGEQFRQYHRFLDHLKLVTEQQQENVSSFEQAVEQRRQVWLQFHQQNEGLQGHIRDVEQDLQKERLKKEQKELDMIVTDSFKARNNN